MDGISAAASVAGVLTIAVQTAVVMKQYVGSAGNADGVIDILIEQLETLQDHLERLKSFLTKQPNSSFTSTSSLLTRMNSSQKSLKTLKDKLDRAKSRRFHKLRWPLSEKEHRQTIQDVRAFSQWIELSLSLDSVAVLMKSSEEIAEILSVSMENMKVLDTINTRTTSIVQSVQARENQQKKEDFFSRLSNYDEQIKHQSVKISRMKETGTWLLNDSKFVKWMRMEPMANTLWCRGDPGVGKTVLSSLVIDYLAENDFMDNETVPMAHLYFEEQNSKVLDPVEVCSSLARQILGTMSTIPESVQQIYQANRKKKLDFSLAKTVLLYSLSVHQKNRIIIDALDECQEEDYRKPVLELLHTLRSRSDVSLFITSRNHCHDIAKAFDDAPQLKIFAQEQDLRVFLSNKIETASIADEIDEELKDVIVNKIISRSGQMFLLAKLQIDAVLDASSPGDMQDACEMLPSTLDDIFGQIVSRIKAQSETTAKLAMQTLLWLTFLKRGSFLRISDLQQILVIKSGQSLAPARYHPWPQKIVKSCQGLVVIDQGTNAVRFTNLVMQEYLAKRAHDLFPDAQGIITRASIQYLSMVNTIESTFESETQLQNAVVSSPFLGYAATSWGYHASMCTGSDITDRAEALLLTQRRNSIFQINLYLLGRTKLYWSAEEARSNTVLHVAARFGLENVVHRLLDSPDIQIDETTSIGTTALMGAASAGHSKIVQSLLDHGADARLMNWFGNSLHCAAEAGREVIVNILLQHNGSALIDVPNRGGFSALSCAISGGHHAVVQTLRKWGAKDALLDTQRFPIDTVNSEHYTWIVRGPYWNIKTRDPEYPACFVAIVAKKLDLARVLISCGASVNDTAPGICTPLAWCAWQGDYEAVKLLLEAGVQVNAKSRLRPYTNKDEHSAYWYAHLQGNKEIMQLLLDFGASPETSHHPDDIRTAQERMDTVTTSILESTRVENNSDQSRNLRSRRLPFG